MRFFVTGATGVLGRRLIPRLIGSGHEVTALVRTDAKAGEVSATGAHPVIGSLFDVDAMTKAVAGHDGICNLATNIPTGAAAGTRRGWRTNDHIRREGSTVMVEAALANGVGRFVQESITFPYADQGNEWIDETSPIEHHWGTETVATAEANAARLTEAGGNGVVLRMAMFVAADSAHVGSFRTAIRRGFFPIPGPADGYFSMLDADDAAAAVLAALDAPAGVYNVAEDEPASRADLATAMAVSVGRTKLRRLPDRVARLGGPPARGMMRSMRISNRHLRDTTNWRPAVGSVARHWEDYT
ncbi:MAG: NAD-dependent epimerase/dehydratase family protein [Acidimicrobiales bacterium]